VPGATPVEESCDSVTRVLHHEEEVMGTIVTIDAYDDPSTSAGPIAPYLAPALRSLHDADEVFSTWKSESPMSRLRRGELDLDQAPDEVREVLEACGTARELSRGWFDPWALPGGVDPTGYVKGWAAQRALNHLRDSGVHGAIVNAAGDIAAFGAPSLGASFRCGITNPALPGELLAVVALDGCLATSGTYERGQHLINPHSGLSATRVASASVTGPDLGMADALATALAVAGDDLLPVIEELAGYEAFTVSFDGQRRWTSKFPLISLAARH
jgi:thiamine biosynthesis lipoprotein